MFLLFAFDPFHHSYFKSYIEFAFHPKDKIGLCGFLSPYIIESENEGGNDVVAFWMGEGGVVYKEANVEGCNIQKLCRKRSRKVNEKGWRCETWPSDEGT